MSDSRFDGSTECCTCDKVNVSNAVYGAYQLVLCDTNDIDTVDEAIEVIERELVKLAIDKNAE